MDNGEGNDASDPGLSRLTEIQAYPISKISSPGSFTGIQLPSVFVADCKPDFAPQTLGTLPQAAACVLSSLRPPTRSTPTGAIPDKVHGTNIRAKAWFRN